VPTLGDLLKRRRKELGHNQSSAGALMGVTGSTVSRWETGEASPSNDQIDVLANYLAKPEAQVLTAIHRQLSGADSNERVLTMLGEVLTQMSELRELIEQREPT
jgi:transcriptional regulator with XRE-family HTH domain